MLIAGFDHLHVTEREIAHQSPCGWDDARWEDCTFMSALEWWRACGHPTVPATHLEGEELRCASGRAITGGTNLADVRKGIAVRYGASTPNPISGFTALWTALVPGTVATCQGSMGAFLVGSPWRRWDPTFDGAHAVCVFRPDATDRVWWCDPLAPQGTYSGEWMPKAAFSLFVNALPLNQHLVAAVVPTQEDPVIRKWKAEPWKTTPGTRRPVRSTPDRANGVVIGYIEDGQQVITTAEVTGTANDDWRGIQFNGTVGYILRSDFNPVVPGGVTPYDATYQSLLAGTLPPVVDTKTAFNSGVDAAIKHAADAKLP